MSGASPYEYYTPPQRIAGGKARARTALRDKYGRFLPNNGQSLPEPTVHGVEGGKARAERAYRDARGRFIKAPTIDF